MSTAEQIEARRVPPKVGHPPRMLSDLTRRGPRNEDGGGGEGDHGGEAEVEDGRLGEAVVEIGFAAEGLRDEYAVESGTSAGHDWLAFVS